MKIREAKRQRDRSADARATTRRAMVCWFVAIASVLAIALPVRPDEVQARRSRIGVRLFRSLLSADLALDRKTVDGGKLLILFYTSNGQRDVDGLEAILGGNTGEKRADGEEEPEIRGLPLEMETTSDPTFAAYANRIPAGIFLAEAPDADSLERIIRYGIAHHVIVYSPFEGHVELGVLAGLSIEAQVRPYLNRATLSASGITLKSFYMKVTKVFP